MITKKMFTFFLCSFLSVMAHKTDMVVFSYHRPLQLYAFLESVEQHIKGLNKVTIIYRVDDEKYEDGYQIVKERFNNCLYVREQPNPELYFKSLFIAVSDFTTKEDVPYILYANDDNIVTEEVDLNECIELLEKHRGYAFYLRLGKNLSYCYSLNQAQPLPPLKKIEPGVYRWKFNKGYGDWRYPHSVDMTIVRKQDIQKDFERMPYNAPNKLEGAWAAYAHPIMHRHGLCYKHSKITNIPLNVVQNIYNNRHMDAYTPDELLEIFMHGKKMDIAPTYHIDNIAAHMEYEPTFIDR